MTVLNQRSPFRSFIGAAITLVVIGALLALTGCASTDGGAISTARRIHAMTPCGMMMESMMNHQGSGHQPATAEPEETTAAEEQSAQTNHEADHVQSHPALSDPAGS